MDLQDILFYIVIGFVGLISYLSQRNAKKQAEEIERRRRQQQETASQENPVTSHGEEYPSATLPQETVMPREEYTLDEIFKALRERKPLPPSKPQKPQMPEISAAPAPASLLQTAAPPVPAPQKTENKHFSTEQAPPKKRIAQPVDTDSEKHTLGHKSINWREAFIASEILNRKY